jgi:hypothetical protein
MDQKAALDLDGDDLAEIWRAVLDAARSGHVVDGLATSLIDELIVINLRGSVRTSE